MIIDLSDEEVSVTAQADDAGVGASLSAAPNAAGELHADAAAPAQLDAAGGMPGGAPPPLTLTGVPHAKMPGTQLSPRQVNLSQADKHAAFIRKVDTKIRDRASKVVADMYLAREVDEFTPRPAGWTDAEYRTAMDARKCGKEAPVYLSLATKTLDSFKRVEAVRPMVAPELHADVKVYVRGDLNIQSTYKVVDVTED
jgi:hypothetical protein